MWAAGCWPRRLRRTHGPAPALGRHALRTVGELVASRAPPSSPRRGWLAVPRTNARLHSSAHRGHERRRARAGARCRASDGLAVVARSSCALGSSSAAFDTSSLAVGNRPWPARSDRWAWRGVAPAAAVRAVASICTADDRAEQARAVRPAEAPPWSWWPVARADRAQPAKHALSREAMPA
jgi:hypothetical protein